MVTEMRICPTIQGLRDQHAYGEHGSHVELRSHIVQWLSTLLLDDYM